MKHNAIETIMGGVVLLVASFFIIFAYKTSGFDQGDSFEYHAKFDRIDGLVVGTEVRVSGVKVGVVKQVMVDPETYLAKVTFTASQNVKLPKDTSAEITSDGLLGNKYLALVPGGEEVFLKQGDEITYTQSAISLENMIGQLVFSNKAKKDEAPEQKDDKSAHPAPKGQARQAPAHASPQSPIPAAHD